MICDTIAKDKPHVGRRLKDAVSHRTKVEGNDKFYDDKKEERLCPRMGDIRKFMIEEIEEEGDLDNQCQ